MKKILIFLLILSVMLSLHSLTYAIIQNTVDTEILSEINQNIKDIYEINNNYYTMATDNGSLKQVTSTDGSNCLVYGHPFGGTIYWHENSEYRYLGNTKEGSGFSNPAFPWDYGWNGVPLEEMNFVNYPWKNPIVESRYFITKNNFCGLYKNNQPFLEQNIIAGLNYYYAGKTGKELVPPDAINPLDSAYRDKIVYTADAKPINASSWVDVTYVEQPPTDTMWGAGVIYIDNGGGSITYLDIPIAPFEMLEETGDFDITPSTTNDYEVPVLTPQEAGTIQAMPRGAEKYDAVVGIPSGEDLYIQVITAEYLVELETSRISGKYTHHYTVPVDSGEKDTEGNPIMVDERRSDSYRYSYSVIKRLEVYSIDHATVSNASIDNGQITICPNTSYYTPPDIEITQNGGYKGKGFKGVIAWNDTLIIDGQTILDGSISKGSTPLPNDISIPKTNKNTLYKENITVDPELLNQSDMQSRTTVYYKLIRGINETKTLTQLNISTNSVTVHTPVVCDGGIYNDKDFDQNVNREETRASIILGRPNMIRVLTEGEHLNIRGYGNRDYEPYVKAKQIMFPFDVYFNTITADKTKFLKANTWCDIPIDKDIIDIFIPTWVDEGNYTVSYRTIAINAADTNETQENANLEINNYVATDTSPVRVIGRLYGFKVTDIEDYPLWKEVFRIDSDTNEHTSNYYYVGKKDCNKVTNGVVSPFTLPLLQGSHPTIQNEGVIATGYTFKFELNTIGDYYNDKDCINITPTFYYVSKDGNTKKEVDLWYSEYFDGASNYFVKVGSDKDKENVKYIKIGDADRNVSKQEVQDTSRILDMTEEEFKNQKAKLGWYDRIVLAKPLRTFIGNTTQLPEGVNKADAKASCQHWYGEYNLPNTLYIASKGFDVLNYSVEHYGLDGEEDFWLKDGYIVVNFNIVTVKDGYFENPILSYNGTTTGDMWEIEGYKTTKIDSNGVVFNLQEGDIVFYDTNNRSTDDYSSSGTH